MLNVYETFLGVHRFTSFQPDFSTLSEPKPNVAATLLLHKIVSWADTSIALQELAGLRRGKNQSAKELADSVRQLASRAYHSNDYASQEKAALHAFQTAVGEDLQLKCAERSCRTLEMEVETRDPDRLRSSTPTTSHSSTDRAGSMGTRTPSPGTHAGSVGGTVRPQLKRYEQ